jgi:hypothetical protein
MDFWANFWPNFASDVAAGVILGALVALVISKRQNKAETQRRKEKILRLLKKELETNSDYINQSIPFSSQESMKDFDTINFLSLGLSNEHWKAFSDGGELQWINDVEILSKLATAYHSIQMVKLSSSAIIRYFFVEQRSSIYIAEHLDSQLKSDIQAALAYINEAIQHIENADR